MDKFNLPKLPDGYRWNTTAKDSNVTEGLTYHSLVIEKQIIKTVKERIKLGWWAERVESFRDGPWPTTETKVRCWVRQERILVWPIDQTMEPYEVWEDEVNARANKIHGLLMAKLDEVAKLAELKDAIGKMIDHA